MHLVWKCSFNKYTWTSVKCAWYHIGRVAVSLW